MTRRRDEYPPIRRTKTDAEIAKELHISRQRVTIIRQRAMEKMRQTIIDDPELAELALELCGFDVVARNQKRNRGT